MKFAQAVFGVVIVACVVAASGLAVIAAGRGDDDSGPPGAQAAPTETPDTPDPRVTNAGNVCQGVVSRPKNGEPRRFAAEYTKQREARGIAIVANADVSDEALDEAVKTVERMFQNNDLEEPLVDEGAYVIVADQTQGVLDLPEFSCLEDELRDDFFDHVCGVADRADYPVATVNELDLLGNREGPCQGLNILYHELGHLVQGWTLSPADYFEVKLLYQAARDDGKYRGEYASTNTNEYFAEATQAFFHYGEPRGGHDRRWLARYDPGMYELLREIYGE